MIDWLNLFFNTLWILALAIALAVLSWSSWQASVQKTTLRIEIQQDGPQRALMLAGLLFSLGLALTTSTWYEQVIWFIFAAYFLLQLARLVVKKDPTEA